mgnify:CR=1 FL=1
MSFAPDVTEQLARARADLRMGVPVVLSEGDTASLVPAAATLSAPRLAAVLALGGGPGRAGAESRADGGAGVGHFRASAAYFDRRRTGAGGDLGD